MQSEVVTPAKSIKTTKIALTCVASVPNCDPKVFQETALKAKAGCPISKALAGVAQFTLDAKLV
jgi:osmotically inducible protein OsmC